ncbi:hypothetical protein B0H66DRAFT_63160 [Apodospora peruviana]|uniref:RBR-type E3 ubiquitin transferase n=1 Tax=Apodospora peruviana TaxID=516989 RepID=A0AAE0ISG2_9PEZI|nr:hypothetical protein B0H66DRAFT_63160 [Apodospora peruviana]
MAAFPSLSPADLASDVLTRPPELSDVDYLREVLGRSDGETEAQVEEALAAKAGTLGIELPLPRPSAAKVVLPNNNALDDDAESPGGNGTLVSQHGRAASTSSNSTTTTGLTSQTSHRSTVIPATLTESTNVTAAAASSRRSRSKSLSFSQYEKYLSQVGPTLHQPKFLNPPSPRLERPIGTLMGTGGGARRSVRDFKRSIAGRLRRRRPISSLTIVTCICCREDFVQEHHSLQTLPCGHTYCQHCLAVLITQSTTDESKMPPRCCTQPYPSAIIKTVLDNRDDQQTFLKAVLQYSTPWEARIFCPNTSCGEFIPPRNKIDPKHPFEATCRSCRTRVCITCKRNAHRLGQDCPEDWELDAVLKMGEKSGWRRCYKCRTLVELTQGCTHMTCRCKAQFCYICGAVWDPAVGCPNFCNGEEELERRRMEEEARLAEQEAEKKALEEAAAVEELARREAEKQTLENAEFKSLRAEQEAEMVRFLNFERKTKELMWARQSKKRLALAEKYLELMDKMKERHAKTEQHLDDRQIQAEIDLMSTLEQSKKSIKIQLKYMEAYCHRGEEGEDDGSVTRKMPTREVTQKHLDQLDQQYRIRDGLERRHQSQINVLRERQTKRMEELMERHKKEMQTLVDKRTEDIEDLDVEFTNEEEILVSVFADRKAKLLVRWEIAGEILRVELEKRHGGPRFAPMTVPDWPATTTTAAEAEVQRSAAEGALLEDGGSNGLRLLPPVAEHEERETDD